MVHIDEIGFILKKDSQKDYLIMDEEKPEPTSKRKNFILKVMFLYAIARLSYDQHCKCFFRGKIGLWFWAETASAHRSSRNRPAGTLGMKPWNVNCDLYRTYFTEKFFPTIRSKFTTEHRSHVVVQQNSARPHVSINDAVVIEHGQKNN